MILKSFYSIFRSVGQPFLSYKFTIATNYSAAILCVHPNHCWRSDSLSSFSSTSNRDEGSADRVTSRSKVTESLQSQHVSPHDSSSKSASPNPRRKFRRIPVISSDTSLNLEEIPSLAEFVHRSKVRKQYRNFIRLAIFLDKQNSVNDAAEGALFHSDEKDVEYKMAVNRRTSGECRAALEEVRLAYKSGRKIGMDPISKSMAYSEGERKLKELRSITGYIPKANLQLNSMTKRETYDSDSWINIEDNEDPRGRVGVKWPWQPDDSR